MPGNGAKPYFADVPDVLPDEVDRVPAAATPPVDVWSRLQGEPETRTRVQAKRAVALTASLVWAVAQFAALGARADLTRLSPFYLFATLLVPFVIGVAALVVAFGRGRLGLGARPSVVIPFVGAGSLVFIALALVLPEPRPGSASDLHSVLECANVALAWAAFPLVGAALTLRRCFPSAPIWRSALVGTAIGLGAAVAAQVRCPAVDSLHVAAAHGGIVVLAALSGAWLLSRVTRV